jgi:ribosomal protein S18 acetylase RimI-like enzyme
MTTVTTLHRRRIVIAFGCAALGFMLGLAEPPAAHAQTSSRDRMPLELWKTYPLEPRTREARLRSGNHSDQAQVPLPSSGEPPARRTTGPVGGRPSAIGDGSSAPLALSVLALALVGLIVTVLVARPVATVARHVPGSLARFGSAVVSPVRSFATVPRPKLAGRALRPAPDRAPALSRRGTAVRRLASRRLAFRALAVGGAGLGRTGGRAARLPLRVGAPVGAALRSAMVGIYSKRGEILLYALVEPNGEIELYALVEPNGEIVGLIVLGVSDEGFLVDNVAVDPSHQGSGVGRALLEHAEVAARRAGFDSICLYTHEEMSENLALYSRIGYVEYDRRLHGDACLVYLRKKLR